MKELNIPAIIIGIYLFLMPSVENQRIYFSGEGSEDNLDQGIVSRVGHSVQPPKFGQDWICGYVEEFPLLHNGWLKRAGSSSSEYQPIYYLNETAEKLKDEGFNVKINEVSFGDVLCNFTFSNSTFQDTLAFEYISSVLPTGGEPAPLARSYYMAQIGEKRDEKITWLCDGVLINNRWILSAAHCFLHFGISPNIVRLGDLDLEDGKEFIRDYPIHQVVSHPEFKTNERYHDIVLIQIPRPVPLRSNNIFPICLPWGTETNNNLVGKNVTLTGWGATEYRGPKISRLHQVNLTVFETPVCDKAYYGVPGNEEKYPQGITEDKVLCVGWNEDGRDACGGDSGAPIVYLKDDFDKSELKKITIYSGNLCGNPKLPKGDKGTRYGLNAQDKRYILAGIVSGGFGCGLKEFPGLYTPINKPIYLQWIKDVAFKDYI